MRELVEAVSRALEKRKLMLATAESCTGGLLAAAMTDRPGSSSIFERGFVTYSNDSKIELLGVDPALIRDHGAVSAQTALAMTHGTLKNSRAAVAVSITGIAGPGGGTPEKPVGLVYIGYGLRKGDAVQCMEHHFTGSRDDIRRQSVTAALKGLSELLDAPD